MMNQDTYERWPNSKAKIISWRHLLLHASSFINTVKVFSNRSNVINYKLKAAPIIGTCGHQYIQDINFPDFPTVY